MSDREAPCPSKPVPAWRIGAGLIVLGCLSLIGVLLIPVYLRNLELEKFLRETPPASDEMLRRAILDKSHALGLSIPADHLQIRRSPAGPRVDVRYVVNVSLPLYTVDLHFSSSVSAGR